MSEHNPLLIKALKQVQQPAQRAVVQNVQKQKKAFFRWFSPRRFFNTLFFWNRFEGNKRRLSQVIVVGLLIVLIPLIIESLMYVARVLAADRGTTSSPIAYWKFDEGVGDTAHNSGDDGSTYNGDLSGSGTVCASGTSTCPAWTTSGKIDDALDFTASDRDFVQVTGLMGSPVNITLSAWVKLDSAESSGADVINIGDYVGIRMEQSGGDGLSAFYYEGSSNWNEITTGISLAGDGEFHHIEYVVDDTNNTHTLYLDGVEIASEVTSTSISYTGQGSNTFIGRHANSGTTFDYDGIIDEVKVYDYARSADQVKADFNLGGAVFQAQDDASASPVGRWDFENTTSDISGNGLGGVPGCNGTSGYINGKIGKAISLSNAVNAQCVSVSDNSLLRPGSGSFTFQLWAKPANVNQTATLLLKFNITNNHGYGILICGNAACSAAGQQMLVFYAQSGVVFRSRLTTADVVDGNWHHYAAVANQADDTVILYVDGVRQETTDGNGGGWPNITNTDSFTFSTGLAGLSYNGPVDNAMIYNYARTPSQILEDYNLGHPIGGSPNASQVGYWKFDEGADNTCSGGTNDICNSGNVGSTLDGTTTSVTRVNTGKVKQGLEFNGTTSVATIANASPIDFDVGLASGSAFTAWINPDNAGEGDGGRIFSKGTNTWMRVDTLSGGRLDIQASLDLETTDATVNVSSAVPTGSFSHVAMVHSDDADDEIDIYVNGILVGSSTNGVGRPIIADTSSLFIGNDTASATQTFDGKIDEFKVYNIGLTASQVKIDLNQGKSLVLGSTGTASDGVTASFEADRSYCPPGDTTSACAPVGYWPFEEGIGQSTFDRSGGGSTGQLGITSGEESQDPVWTNGWLGKALNFNSTADAVGVTTTFSGLSDMTYEAWIFPRTGGANNLGRILHKDNSSPGISFMMDDGFSGSRSLRFEYGFQTSAGQWNSSNSVITMNAWNHVAVTFDSVPAGNDPIFYVNGKRTGIVEHQGGSGSNISDDNVLIIGNRADVARGFDGIIDEAKVYNYIRTPAQIAWDYTRGKPIVHYKLDECTGTTVNDSMGNGATGSITIGGLGTQTAVGNCSTASTAWGNGVTGKRNYSLNFDGTDDLVAVSDTTGSIFDTGTGDLSAGAWIKTSSASKQAIIAKGPEDDGTNTGWSIFKEDDGQLSFFLNDGTLLEGTFTSDIDDGNWHHVFVTFDRDGNATGYVDGRSVGTVDISARTATLDNNDSFALASFDNGAGFFAGQIDDVQLYNYVLTGAQVKSLYNGGALRWGPVTGAP